MAFLVPVAVIASLLLVIGCGGRTPDPEPTPRSSPVAPTQPVPTATPTPSPAPTAQPTPSPTPSPTPTSIPTPTATPTPSATPTPTPEPRLPRCEGLEERGDALTQSVLETMDGMSGWGLSLVDLDCEVSIHVMPGHGQYTASSGKIIVVTTVLRAVQDGLLDLEEYRPHIEIVMSLSLDIDADLLNDLLTPEQIATTLERAGVSEASRFEHSWRWAHMTAPDMARFWVSLVRGRQLNEELTAYVLDLATRPILGEAFWPFPADFGVEGYVYGQKAGYWTSPDPIGYRVSAGFMRPGDGSGEGYVFAFLIRVADEDWASNWRRPIFPIVLDFMTAEMERVP